MLRLPAAILLAAVLALSGDAPPRSLQSAEGPTAGAAAAPQVVISGEMQVTQEWFDWLFGNVRKRFEPSRRVRQHTRREERSDRTDKVGGGGTYRTLCVRQCDGFYFPISYSTTRKRFADDARQCEQRCPGSRLYVHRNPGEDVEDMLDLEGRAYISQPNALLYRTRYVADCTCRGNPWDEASLARHRSYRATSDGGQ